MLRKRGRPKIRCHDVQKRGLQTLSEPLDLCLEYSIINSRQHKAALKLRWLYILHFGLPTIQGYDLAKVRGRGISKYSERWLEERRSEYKKIAAALHNENKYAAKLLYNIVIYHYYPIFLKKIMQWKISKHLRLLNVVAMHTLQPTDIKISDKELTEKKLFKLAIQTLEEISDEVFFRDTCAAAIININNMNQL